jgi:hypothetical protein
VAGRAAGKKEENIFEPDVPERDGNAGKTAHYDDFRTNVSLKK